MDTRFAHDPLTARPHAGDRSIPTRADGARPGDPAAGLATRGHLLRAVAAAYGGGHALGVGAARLALVLIEVRGLRRVRAADGGDASGVALARVARRLVRGTRRGDVVARLGDETFGALLVGARRDEDARAVTERLLATLGDSLAAPAGPAALDLSAGIAHDDAALARRVAVRARRPRAEALLRSAALALAAARERGAGEYVSLTARLDVAPEPAVRPAELRRALDRGELRLVYQPIVDLDACVVRGVEALARWDHPERGSVSPCDFIPVAEASGLIVPVGRWALASAARAVAAGPTGAGARAFVNVSVAQIQHPSFVADVEGALSDAGLAPDRLVLEITERTLASHPDVVRDRLARLRGSGVRVAIDDFGTGYSALHLLRQLPADVLKLDKSFTDAADDGAAGQALAAAIVRMADALALETVAEGVERGSQHAALAGLGCRLGQGYLFGPPASLGAAADASC